MKSLIQVLFCILIVSCVASRSTAIDNLDTNAHVHLYKTAEFSLTLEMYL